jgi:hypothetical protein
LPDFTKAANLSAFTRPENWFVLPDFTKAENWSVLADFTKPANLSDFTRAENWSVLPDFTWNIVIFEKTNKKQLSWLGKVVPGSLLTFIDRGWRRRLQLQL